MLSSIPEWVIAVFESLGYFGIAGLIALENLFPPIPSEVVLPLAGFLVGRGQFFFLWVILSATGGSVANALALYWVGAWLGESRVRRALNRFGRFLFLHEEDLDRACHWFDRHGEKRCSWDGWFRVCAASSPFPLGSPACPSGSSWCTRQWALACGIRR
jgi:membrane protein DedA with SNARE-associated domain